MLHSPHTHPSPHHLPLSTSFPPPFFSPWHSPFRNNAKSFFSILGNIKTLLNQSQTYLQIPNSPPNFSTFLYPFSFSGVFHKGQLPTHKLRSFNFSKEIVRVMNSRAVACKHCPSMYEYTGKTLNSIASCPAIHLQPNKTPAESQSQSLFPANQLPPL